MLLPERTAFLTLRSRSSNYLRGGVASPSPSLFFISIVSIRIPYITHLHLRPESVFPHCQLRAEMDSHHPAYLCPAMSTYGEAIRRYGVLSSWHRAKTEPKSCVIRTPFRARSHLQSHTSYLPLVLVVSLYCTYAGTGRNSSGLLQSCA
jgi:hypothetical protein